ncbi:hypothetical protein [Aeromonas simiae]|uniref:hypothetical protein n=1 Tax=Aeromonas simiae TaxID=218936 RepID=UPI0005A7146B|nr:hypothetical protein [Aeromonas simiae]MDO2952029.1 hypothetical protein [Aeromonas simiae]
MTRTLSLLAEAQQLVGHNPFTLSDARSLEYLEEQAMGEEGLLIAELWEEALLVADDEARLYISGMI